MSQKHTQGKWILRGSQIKDESGQDVCFMSVNPAYVLSEEEKNYAQLILAAPEMLEALQQVRDKLASHPEYKKGRLIKAVEKTLKAAMGDF